MEGPIPACQGAISTSFVGILPGIKCYAWLLMGALGLNRSRMAAPSPGVIACVLPLKSSVSSICFLSCSICCLVWVMAVWSSSGVIVIAGLMVLCAISY